MAKSMSSSHTIENDAENLRQRTSQLAGDMEKVGAALKTLAEDSWSEVQDKLHSLYEQGKDRYTAAGNRLESKVRSDPLRAILIAAGIGFVVGYFKKVL